MSTGNEKVISLGHEKKFTKEGELARRITEIIAEYNEEISLVAAVGVLELVKNDLVRPR